MKTTITRCAALAMLVGTGLAQAAPAQRETPQEPPCHARDRVAPPHDVTREEFMKRAAQHFELLDVNHDGTVSREELRSMRGHKRGQLFGPPPDAHPEQGMKCPDGPPLGALGEPRPPAPDDGARPPGEHPHPGQPH